MKKQLKKSLSLLLTLVMVLGLLPTAALAATTITPTTPAGSGTSADPYRIGTAEELYGFAAIVNGGDTDAHAILTADITVNENVLSYYVLNGTEEDFVAWDPMNLYDGIFDGRGHTISGLFISYTESNQYDHCGFIEELRGIVRDLTITDSYFRVCYGYYSSSGGVATATANRNIGGICGKLDATGTVWQCHFDGVIDADQGTSTGGFKIGGIVGYNFGGTIKECSLSGRVDGKAGGSDSGVGGIVGVSSGGTVTRCCTNAPVTNVMKPSAAKNGQASVGGIVGHLSGGTVTDSYTSYNSGSIWGYGYVGGIVGSAEGCDLQRCWNHRALFYLEDDYQEDTYIYMGGILGHAGGTNTSNVIKNCYNHGTIYPWWRSTAENPYTGAGIVGNYDDSKGATLSISYCHNMGKYVGDRLYNNASDTYNPIVTADKGTISNCYYKIDNNEVGERDEVENTVAYQLKDFENGTVVNLLNDQPLFDNQNYWEQGEEGPELVARPEIVPIRLEILTHPTKTEYTAGEDFDPTGMVVQMHYSDGSVLPVVGYTVSGGECMLNTVKSVAIYYTDNGVTLHTDEPVTVTGENPTYKVTVNLQGTGGGTYTVGSRVTIKARSVNNAQFVGWNGLADVKIIQGSVTSQSVTFIMPKKNVTATPIYGEVKSIAVTKEPKKTVYYEGEDFDPTGMVVTAYTITIPIPPATKGEKVELPITNYTVTNGTDLEAGQTSVTIRHQTGTGVFDAKTTTQPITVHPVPTVTVTNGTGGGSYIPGTEVTVTANAADDQIFWSWRGLPEDIEITEGSAFAPSMTFVMPDEDVTLEAVLETIELAQPQGDGTASNPFEISNMEELYWFQRFVNGALTAEDITVEPTAACAKVVKDITVNADLLDSDGMPAQTFGLAKWTPIAMGSSYTGTFDGQNHTISGIYYDPQSAVSSPYAGFFGSLGEGSGTICNLTLADSYFCAPIQMENAYTGGIVGQVPLGSTVENCHFNGTVTTGDSEGRDGMGGIAAINRGVIRDCTTKGKVYGYGFNVGGIAGYAYRDVREDDEGGEVIGCVNEATVGTTMTLDDSLQFTSGGIVGSSSSGIIRDCCNKGDLTSIWVVGGIVGQLEGTNAAVIRCWNEGRIERGYGAGIVSKLGTYASIDNCYNAGVASYAGIAATFQQGHNTISNCHNVGEITRYAEYPICGVPSGSNITIENCYYLGTAETDAVVGTTYKTAAEFRNGTVLELLNSGDNAGNWKQDTQYPVLAELYTIVVDTINIKGITAPVAGEAPVITGITTDTAGITLKNVQWQNGSSVMNSTNKFEPGQTYNLWVRYEVADGYAVSESVTVTSDLANSTYNVNTAVKYVDIQYTIPAAVPTTYTVTVNNGTASPAGPNAEGTEVTVTADPDPEGKKFKEWQIEGLSTTTSESRSIFFYMPANNVTITAIYEDANIIIESASATITEPVVGANPDFNIVSADESKYTVTVVKWNLLDGSSYPVLTAGDKFVRGESYQLDVKFVANPGYEFSDSCVYNVNGVPRAAYSLTKGERRCYFDVYEIIDTINVKGVVAPVAGAIPDVRGITSDTDGINVIEVKWRDKDGYAFEGDPFVAGEKYILWLKYETESDYKVADDAEVTFNISDSNILDKEITHPIIKMTYEVPAASAPTYTVTVNNGTGSGDYAEGASVTITANAPDTGKQFKEWTTEDGVIFADATASTTTFTMPAKPVTITAVFENIPKAIGTVTISDLTKPVVGEMPDNSITVNGTGVTFGDDGSYWGRFDSPRFNPDYDDDTAVVSVAFRDGETYMFQLWLYAEDGYEFTEDSKFVFAGTELPALDMTDLSKTGAMVNPEDSTETLIYINMNDVPGAAPAATTLRGAVTVDGTSAKAEVTVEHLSSGAQALLIVAQYSGNQMTAAQILTVTAEGTFTPENPFTHADGCTYKAFLVDTDSCEPLCEAAALIVQEK